jgi:hypothetical protein
MISVKGYMFVLSGKMNDSMYAIEIRFLPEGLR